MHAAARTTLAAALWAGLALPLCARAETHTVVIQFFQFKPQTIDVKPGDEVEFVNRDLLEHTATASNNAFDSKSIKGGQSWKWKAGEPGQYPYVPNMTVENAVAIAGGFTPRASKDKVTITRKIQGAPSRYVLPLR